MPSSRASRFRAGHCLALDTHAGRHQPPSPPQTTPASAPVASTSTEPSPHPPPTTATSPTPSPAPTHRTLRCRSTLAPCPMGPIRSRLLRLILLAMRLGLLLGRSSSTTTLRLPPTASLSTAGLVGGTPTRLMSAGRTCPTRGHLFRLLTTPSAPSMDPGVLANTRPRALT